MRQPMIPRYRFISPIKTPCRCPHMSRPWLLICSPRFSAWLINKCPCNFAQLVSHSSHRLNGEEKNIPFWCTSEETQTPHLVVLITASRPYRTVCQWPPSLGPRRLAYALQTSAAVINQPPPNPHLHHLTTLLSTFPVLPLLFASSPMSIPPHSLLNLSSLLHSLLPAPVVFLHFCSLFIPSCNQIMVTPCWC